MLNIALVDDDLLYSELVEQLVTDCMSAKGFPCRCSRFGSAKECPGLFDGDYDIVLLDIFFGEGNDNGIEIAQRINSGSERTRIIFITAYSHYSEDISDSNFCYYLQKPVRPEKLDRALSKAVEGLQRLQPRTISIFSRGRILSLPGSRIVYVESSKHNVVFHLQDGKTEIVRDKLDSYSGKLTPENGFCRIHKSYIVSFASIERMEPSRLLLRSGEVLPVSRTHASSVKQSFAEWLLKN